MEISPYMVFILVVLISSPLYNVEFDQNFMFSDTYTKVSTVSSCLLIDDGQLLMMR